MEFLWNPCTVYGILGGRVSELIMNIAMSDKC